MTIPNPAGRQVVGPGGSIQSDWGNNAWDQTIQQFANVASRDSAFPAPRDGVIVYTIAEKTHWRRRAGAWVAVMELGVIDQQISSAAINLGTTDTAFYDETRTIPTGGRKIRLSAFIAGSVTTAGSYLSVRMTAPGMPDTAVIAVPSAGLGDKIGYAASIFDMPAGLSHFILRGFCTGGVFNIAANNARFWIEDLGPTGIQAY